MIGSDFLKMVIKDYRIGAFTASSEYVVQRIVRELPGTCRFVVEYGAGDGVITKGILKKLPADGKLLAIELNKDFLAELRKIQDPRLLVVEGDAAEVSQNFSKFGMPLVEAVVSGIPFTLIAPKVRAKIVKNTHAALAAEGLCIVYQYTPLMAPLLKKAFGNLRLLFEARNFLPYFIMISRK